MFVRQMLADPKVASVSERRVRGGAKRALGEHWPEYLIEATCLGLFMLSACTFTVLLQHPASPIRSAVANPGLRRFLTGVMMGSTAIALIYSPIGRRSGAHMNPAITLTFFRLGKVEHWDALFYAAAQFIGGVAGSALAFLIFRSVLFYPNVNFAATMPGMGGVLLALAAEIAISFLMMTTVLWFSNTPRLARYTGLAAGALVMLFITFEGPLSGMSMNPARSFASDFVGMQWNAIWIYFVGPILGMLIAAEVYVRRRGRYGVACAKLNHAAGARCIFRCGYIKKQAMTQVA